MGMSDLGRNTAVTRGGYCGSGVRAEDGGVQASSGHIHRWISGLLPHHPAKISLLSLRYHEFLLPFYGLSLFASIVSNLSLVFQDKYANIVD